MAITSGFFNSVDGDRKYNAEEISNYFEGIVSNGVIENVGSKLAVTSNNNMTVTVGTGRAFINSHWVKNDAALTLSIEAADVQYNRLDVIALRLDTSEANRQIKIIVKKGTPATSPSAPLLERSGSVYELYLAGIYVAKGATSILQRNITDFRAMTIYCGYVTGLIKQVDTTDLVLQYQDAFENFYEESTQEFDEYFDAKKTAFEAWYAGLTEELNLDLSIVKYQNVVEVETMANPVKIGISQYKTGDPLLVFVDGILFNENEEYTISGSGENATITFTTVRNAAAEITFVVFKNVIGTSVTAGMLDEINGEVI